MNRLTRGRCLAALCVVVILLQGCAAATVVRQPPDFEEEKRQYLLQSFPPGTFAESGLERTTRIH